MTKTRAPLSIEQALQRITGNLPHGVKQAAEITGRSPSMVRAWGDPERREKIPMDDAILLDIAHVEHGGQGTPLRDCYVHQLELAAVSSFAERFVLLDKTIDLLRESSEAHEALLQACRPGAGPNEQRRALKELADVVEKAQPMIASLDPDNPAPSPIDTGAFGQSP